MVIIAYTHTDMKDVWPVFFGRLKKYMSNYKTYVFVNDDSDLIPAEYTRVLYDDKLKYTQRIFNCIDKVQEDVILFLHEDMILYDTPNIGYLKKYEEYILNNIVNGIKLIATSPNNNFIKSSLDETLVTSEFSKFSIQPTILKKELFKTFFENKEFSIWEFEDKTNFFELQFMVKIGPEKKRGLYHYDSLVFPYTATAINKGRWNMTEYQKELNDIFEEYDINPFDRGIW
jgi:hypothetical protein